MRGVVFKITHLFAMPPRMGAPLQGWHGKIMTKLTGSGLPDCPNVDCHAE
jgi:hypothetical protein